MIHRLHTNICSFIYVIGSSNFYCVFNNFNLFSFNQLLILRLIFKFMARFNYNTLKQYMVNVKHKFIEVQKLREH